MKLPTDIVTRHKIRDSKILSLYSRDTWSFEDIGKRFNISATRVGQIIYKNRHLLKIDKEYEKVKRVYHLKRLFKKHSDSVGKKDAIDILEHLRVESEGNKVEHTGEGAGTKIIIIRPEATAKESPISIIRPSVEEALDAGSPSTDLSR